MQLTIITIDLINKDLITWLSMQMNPNQVHVKTEKF